MKDFIITVIPIIIGCIVIGYTLYQIGYFNGIDRGIEIMREIYEISEPNE